jgi:hypothetical protein
LRTVGLISRRRWPATRLGHSAVFSASAAAQIVAYDVIGDGLSDLITALAAHGLGLA